MAIYVYTAGETNFDSMGICGALTPKRCEFSEKRNGMSQIVMEHPIDDFGRWAMLVAGCILKVDVPVRTTPEIDGTTLITTVEKWKVKTTATSGQRKLYSKPSGGRVIKTLPIWADKAKTQRFEVTVVRKGSTRYKAKTKYGSGWIPLSGLEYSVTDTIANDPAAIETVEPAWTVKPQLFRMRMPKKTHKGVTVTASHIFYDLAGNITTYEPYSSTYPAWSSATSYTVGDMAARGGLNYFCITPHTNHAPPNATYWIDADSCFAALSKITGNCLIPHEFEGYTNLKDQRVGATWTRAKAVEALLAPNTGLVDRWGAELIRDNFEFYILREAGRNRGVRIEWKKNLLGIEYTTDITDVVARIMPIGKTHKGKPLFLVPGTYNVNGTTVTIGTGETWVTSPQAGDYAAPLMDTLDTDIKAKSGDASDVLNARLKMIEAVLNYFADTQCDQPTVNVRVDFVNLGKTIEYEQFKQLDDVYLCDRVRVRHPGIDVDVLTEVIGTVWDCLTGRFKSVELGRVQLDRMRVKTPVWQLPAGIPGTLFAPGTVDAGALADGAVNDTHLAPMAVTEPAIADGAVTRDKIGQLAVGLAQIDTANINWANIANLAADIANIAKANITTANITNANIDWANIVTLSAAVATIAKAQITTANIQSANIAWANITNLTVAVANIADARIGNAVIDYAKIRDLLTDTAIITQGTAGKLYISRLAVTEANMVNLTVGTLVVRGEDGRYYRVSVNEQGQIVTTEVQMSGDNIADGAVEGHHIVEDTITTRELYVDQIFGDSAVISKITTGIITAGTLFSSEAFISALEAGVVNTDVIRAISDHLDIRVGGTNIVSTRGASATGGVVIDNSGLGLYYVKSPLYFALTSSGTPYGEGKAFIDVELVPGETYTVSFWAWWYKVGGGPRVGTLHWNLWRPTPNGYDIYDDALGLDVSDFLNNLSFGTPKRYSFTFTMPTSVTGVYTGWYLRFILLGNDDSSRTFFTTDPQIEVGNTATDWSLSPQDAQASLSLKIDQATLTATTNGLQGQIDAIPGQVTLRAGQINRNLFTDRTQLVGIFNTTDIGVARSPGINGIEVEFKTSNWSVCRIPDVNPVNGWYTVSFLAASTVADFDFWMDFNDLDAYGKKFRVQPANWDNLDEWTRIEYTVNTTEGNGRWLDIAFADVIGKMFCRNFKVEAGKIATPYNGANEIIGTNFQVTREGVRLDQNYGSGASKTYLGADAEGLGCYSTATNQRFAGLGYDNVDNEGYLEATQLRHPNAPAGTYYRMREGTIDFWMPEWSSPISVPTHIFACKMGNQEVGGQAAAHEGAVGDCISYYSRGWMILDSMRGANVPGGKLILGVDSQDQPTGYFRGHYRPQMDNTYNIGTTNSRWKKVYAVSGSIDTSDEREKHDIHPADPEMLRNFIMALDVDWFRLNGLPEELMIGFIAQKFREAMYWAGLPDDFGGYVDELPDHSRLALRYGQVIAPLVSVAQQQQRLLEIQDDLIETQGQLIQELQYTADMQSMLTQELQTAVDSQRLEIDELKLRLDELAGRPV